MSSEVSQQTIERPVLGVGRAQFQGFISKDFVGSKAGVLAIQPVAKIGQDGSSFWEREEASVYSTSTIDFATFFGLIQKCERQVPAHHLLNFWASASRDLMRLL
jgi:hypothetical protein